MKVSRLPGKTFRLSNAVQQRLNGYALAASAAGVGVLALSQPAEAKVVYTPVYIEFSRNSGYLLNFTGQNKDFVIANNFSNFGNRISYRLFVYDYAVNSVAGIKDASPLRAGAEIGPKAKFSHAATLMAHFYTYSGSIRTSSGDWKNVKNRYLGLKFVVSGKVHYGWARMSVTMHKGGTYGISAVLTGYAYETIANKPIIAGKTRGSDVITMRRGTLGQLAMGHR